MLTSVMPPTQLISVIVPVYNAEKYLRRCVDSIINQTYRNLEIILVNDGSTDNSGAICDGCAANDERVVAVHKENGGVSSARNLGVGISTGIFVTFVDNDDYIENDCIEYLYRLISDNNASISAGRYNRIVDGKIIPYQRSLIIAGSDANDNTILCTTTDIMSDMFYSKVSNGVWATLYSKRDIAKYRFNEKLDTYEDLGFNYDIFKDGKPIVLGSKCVYNWVIRKQSSLHNISESSILRKFEALKEFKSILSDTENTEFYHSAVSRYMSLCFFLLVQIDKQKFNDIYIYI